MNAMRLGLLAIGVLCIVGVWVFNKIQERRVRRRIEGPYARERSDVLLDRAGAAATGSALGSSPGSSLGSALGSDSGGPMERAEPRFGLDPNDRSGFTDDRPVDGMRLNVEPRLGEPRLGDGSASTSERRGLELDELIHAVILISLEQPVSGERAITSFFGLRHAGRQPVTVLGREQESWYPLDPAGRYDTLVVLMQLASRNGPINEVEYSEFVTGLQYVVDQLSGQCEPPDMMETVSRARALDARCAQLDRQIGISLANPRGQWAGTDLAQICRDAGLVLRLDGRFHRLDADGESLFSLQNEDGPAFRADTFAQIASAKVTLVLDVPLAEQAALPYEQMTTTAQMLAQSLDAVLVDDQLRTLTPAMLAAIARQIEPVYAELAAGDMAAGSIRARTLFR